MKVVSKDGLSVIEATSINIINERKTNNYYDEGVYVVYAIMENGLEFRIADLNYRESIMYSLNYRIAIMKKVSIFNFPSESKLSQFSLKDDKISELEHLENVNSSYKKNKSNLSFIPAITYFTRNNKIVGVRIHDVDYYCNTWHDAFLKCLDVLLYGYSYIILSKVSRAKILTEECKSDSDVEVFEKYYVSKKLSSKTIISKSSRLLKELTPNGNCIVEKKELL